MMYKGSCHCGAVSFDVEADITKVVSCNCSICTRKGALLYAVPRSALRLHTPEQEMGTYTFNNHAIRHRFCKTCGMHPYGENTGDDGGTAFVNVRYLNIDDLASIPVLHFDGRSV